MLAAAVPSLRTVIFTSNGLILDAGYWRLISAWRVTRHGSSAGERATSDFGRDWHVDELGSEEIQTILKREDLSNLRDETVDLWDFIADEFPP